MPPGHSSAWRRRVTRYSWRAGRLEQRLERAANPAGIAACQVRSDHGFIDLLHSPLIARDDSRRPFFRLAGAPEEGSPRQRERDRAGRSRERPLSHAIAVAPSDVTALVGTRPERGPQLLVDGRLDRSANVLVDQFAERDGLTLLRPRFFLDTLAHGVFLRWPPLPGGALVVHFTNRKNAPLLFSTILGTRPRQQPPQYRAFLTHVVRSALWQASCCLTLHAPVTGPRQRECGAERRANANPTRSGSASTCPFCRPSDLGQVPIR